MIKRTTSVLILTILGILGTSYYWSISRNKLATVEFTDVTKGDISHTVSATGTVNPLVLVNVGTQVSGIVQKIYVDFNDKVKKGQLLMELDPTLLNAQAQQSKAQVSNSHANYLLAEKQYNRYLALYDKQLVSKADLDTHEQNYLAAKAQLTAMTASATKDRTNLNYTKIISPVDGIIVSREVDQGQTVAASLQAPTLFKIAQDLKKLQINSNFAEADIGKIKENLPVEFTVDAFPSKKFNGVVRQIRLNPTTISNVVTYNVVVDADNPDSILLPGMTAYVTVVLENKQGVLKVPNAALRYKPLSSESKPIETMAKGKGKQRTQGLIYKQATTGLSAIPVTVGLSDGKFTEILTGDLTEQDKVATGNTTGANTDTTSKPFISLGGPPRGARP